MWFRGKKKRRQKKNRCVTLEEILSSRKILKDMSEALYVCGGLYTRYQWTQDFDFRCRPADGTCYTVADCREMGLSAQVIRLLGMGR